MGGPLRWLGAAVAAVAVFVIAVPLALEALRGAITFGGDDPTAAPTEEAGTEAATQPPDVVAEAGPTPTPIPDPASTPQTYTIEAGDTLFSIAEQFYGDGQQYTRIQEANDLGDSALQVGQELQIPPPEE